MPELKDVIMGEDVRAQYLEPNGLLSRRLLNAIFISSRTEDGINEPEHDMRMTS
jgi:hypothetical protein